VGKTKKDIEIGGIWVIRGISKNVIEISDTGNECFERAILFVGPKGETLDRNSLQSRAREYLNSLKIRHRLWTARHWGAAALKLVGAAAVGAAITAFVLGG